MEDFSRTVLRLSGDDCVSFLQNLVTNDVEGLQSGLVWTALLTPQGKYLADFFLVPDGDAVLIDVSTSLAPALTQRLSLYKLRAAVTIEATDIVPAQGIGATEPGAFEDPRHPEMGWRAYDGREGEDIDWTARRVTAEVPETGIELIPNESYPLEMGFERLNGVDFRKGCYVGQEVTARMHHKTELRKGLRQVRVEGKAVIGTDIINESGRNAGTLYSQSNGFGLAYLRFDRVTGDMTADKAIVSLVD